MPPCILLQGTELVERISKKKELGCKCVSFMTVEEQKAERKATVFWDLLGGKQKAKGTLEEVLFVSLYTTCLSLLKPHLLRCNILFLSNMD